MTTENEKSAWKIGALCEVFYSPDRWIAGGVVRVESDGMVRVSHGTHAVSVRADRVREPWAAVAAERDRLRAAIHSFRDDDDLVDFVSAGWVAERLDAILDGTEAERAAAESWERDAVRALVKAGGKS